MSYDVNVGNKNFNYTSNVRKLFNDHIQGEDEFGAHDGIEALNGKTGAQAVKMLGEAFAAMNATRHQLYVENVAGEPNMTAKYDVPNGWGSTIGGILFMGQIMAACAEFPNEIVEVY